MLINAEVRVSGNLSTFRSCNTLHVHLGLRMRHLESHRPVLLPNQPPELKTEPNQTATNTESAPRVHQNCLQPEFACSLSGDIVHLRAFDLLHNPIWIFDIEHWQMRWANQASLYLWNASTQQQLISRNFSDMSEPTRIRLQSYLQQFEQGKTLSEQWTFYPGGERVSVRCRCSGIRIDSGRLAILVEGTVETAHQIEPETLRSIQALRSHHAHGFAVHPRRCAAAAKPRGHALLWGCAAPSLCDRQCFCEPLC